MADGASNDDALLHSEGYEIFSPTTPPENRPTLARQGSTTSSSTTRDRKQSLSIERREEDIELGGTETRNSSMTTQVKSTQQLHQEWMLSQPPRLPDSLRGITSDFGVFGTKTTINNDAEIIARAQVAPLPRALTSSFICVFPKSNDMTPGGGGGGGGGGSVSESSGGDSSPSQFSGARNNQYTMRSPFQAEIVDAKYLTTGGPGSSRRVVRMDFNLLPDKSSKQYNPFKAKKMIRYIPGDAIGVVAPNNSVLVNWLFLLFSSLFCPSSFLLLFCSSVLLSTQKQIVHPIVIFLCMDILVQVKQCLQNN